MLLAFLGPVCVNGTRRTSSWLGPALAMARVLPGVCLLDLVLVGPAGATLLADDACLGGLTLRAGSSWSHVFSALKLNTGLRKLNLSMCRLRPSAVALLSEALAIKATLQELNVEFTNLRDADGLALATALTTHAALRVLHMEHTHVGSRASVLLCEAMVGNSVLQELVLCDAGLGMASGVALADAVRHNGMLQVLDLSFNTLGRKTKSGWESSSWPAVFEALEDNVTLHTLRFQGCELSAAEGEMLASSLEKRPIGSLRSLDVSYNFHLGDAVCSAIITACVEPGSALHELDLEKAGVGPMSGLSLARLLRTSDALQVLVICSPPSEEEKDLAELERIDCSWPALFAALADNAGLRKLAAWGCGIPDDEGVLLATALQTNRALHELQLGWNALGNEAAWAFVALLQSNTTLRELNTGHKLLDDDAKMALVQAGQASGCSVLFAEDCF